MSFFKKVFGGGKNVSKTPESGPSEAIQRLLQMEEMLAKKQAFLEHRIAQEIATAKKLATKNRRLALQALNRKKKIEKQLRQMDGTLTAIEYQRDALENAKTNAEVLKMMGFAAKALKNAHDVDVDKVHDLMDEIQDQQDLANEISEAISSPVGSDKYFDEDELNKELEDLEQEELDEQLLAVDISTTRLPSPVAEPSRTASAEPSRVACAESCGPTSAEPCGPATAQLGRPASDEPSGPTTAKPSRAASAKPCGPDTAEPSRAAAAESSGPTTAEPSRTASAELNRPASAEPSRLALVEEDDKELTELAAWAS